MSEKYPIENVYLNMETHCTIDEAIGMLIGTISREYFPKEFVEMSEEERYGFAEDRRNLVSYALLNDLDDMRSNVVFEYLKAKHEKMSDDVLKEKLDKIKEFDDVYIKKARTYLLQITDAIVQGTLRVNEHNDITLQSLHEWAVKNHKFSILDVSAAGTAKVTKKKTAKSTEEGLSSTKTKGFYLTFVCLLNAFLEKTTGRQFGQVGNLNVTALSKYLAGKSGQSDEAIKDRIEEALADFEEGYPKYVKQNPVKEKK